MSRKDKRRGGGFSFRTDGPRAHRCDTSRQVKIGERWDWDTNSYQPIYRYVCSVCG